MKFLLLPPYNKTWLWKKESPGPKLTGEGQAVSVILRASWGMRGHQWPDRCRQVARDREGMILKSFCGI